MQILYFEDETEKKLKAENLKVKAENEELRGELAEKKLASSLSFRITYLLRPLPSACAYAP